MAIIGSGGVERVGALHPAGGLQRVGQIGSEVQRRASEEREEQDWRSPVGGRQMARGMKRSRDG